MNRELWREQIDRVREGLDPIGIIRDPEEAAKTIRIPSDLYYDLDWEEGMELFNLTPEERYESILNPPAWLEAKPRGRGFGGE